jgi:Na+-transporting methylmalonyl-CoA/oxaloacetate decarboxylase gamma subunit
MFNSLCLLCFVFSFISPFVLCFPSVSNFYFTSQYHQFPLSHAAAAAAAAATADAAAAAAAVATAAAQNTKNVNKNVNKTKK